MGNTCSSSKSTKVRKSDPNGSRRLSVTQQPDPVIGLPPNVTKEGVIERGDDDPWQFACVSVAGTYFQPSANPFKGNTKYKTNQDSFFMIEKFRDQADEHYFGVLDGHGSQGHFASQYVARELPEYLAVGVKKTPDESIDTLLHDSFVAVDRSLEQSEEIDAMLSGTTVTTVHIKGNTVTCANAGDSRCVVGHTDENHKLVAKDLSRDHKPDDADEKERILKAGGRVAPLESWPEGPHRVWLKEDDLPGLAMSRSIGDGVAHSVGVSAVPEIMKHTFNSKSDEYFIVASDGVWEFISSQEALNIVSAMPTPKAAAEQLCKIAVDRWAEEEPVCDDITALVIFLQPVLQFQ